MTQPNLNVYAADGRYSSSKPMRAMSRRGDAYRLPYIPWHLTTVEFFQELRDHMTDQGVWGIMWGYS
jgi:hypothetical protein